MSQPRWASPAERQRQIERDLRPLRDALVSFGEAHPQLANVVRPFNHRFDRGLIDAKTFADGSRMEEIFRNLAARGDAEAAQALALIQTAIRGITQAPGSAGTFADLRRHFEPTNDEQATWLRQGFALPSPAGLIRQLFPPSGP